MPRVSIHTASSALDCRTCHTSDRPRAAIQCLVSGSLVLLIESAQRLRAVLKPSPRRTDRMFARPTAAGRPGSTEHCRMLIDRFMSRYRKVLARLVAGAVPRWQASRLRLPRHLAFGQHTAHGIVHPTLVPARVLYRFQHAYVLVRRVRRHEGVSERHSKSMPALT
jgi:hypothetical protein